MNSAHYESFKDGRKTTLKKIAILLKIITTILLFSTSESDTFKMIAALCSSSGILGLDIAFLGINLANINIVEIGRYVNFN